MRIDLHVHSRFSKRPSQWVLQKLGCAESFTTPEQIYTIATAKGMTHVTITDHNVIDGALAIAHLPNTFISEEITTYFPEDNCKVHVLAHDITEAQHADIQKVRPNIFDLVTYLNEQNIFHAVAHPLYAINDRLTPDHVEKLLLLFRNLELNGARNNRENEAVRRLAAVIDETKIMQLAEKYRLEPMAPKMWQKRLLGGSDDHSSLNITRTHTHISGPASFTAFAGNPDCAKIAIQSMPATPLTMAHNLYGIAYQFYHEKFQLDRYVDKDPLMGFLDHSLRQHPQKNSGVLSKLYFFFNCKKGALKTNIASDSLMVMLRKETRRLVRENPDLISVSDQKEAEKRWFDFVNQCTNRIGRHLADRVIGKISGGNFFNLFETLGSAGGMYTLLAPYFVAYSQYAKDRFISLAVLDRFEPKRASNRAKTRVAHFTDTFYEINGVAKTLQQQLVSALQTQKDLTLITCQSDHLEQRPGVKNFTPIGAFTLPEYPEQKLFYPPLLEMLDFVYRHGFTHIHAATPGPTGLVALAVARLLKLPISSTYHTTIPQYAKVLTNDDAIKELTWRFILWYYGQMDSIYAPSESIRQELVGKGLDRERIHLYPRGIDTKRFHPIKRNGFYQKRFQLKDELKLLYVGRISKEKSLDQLVTAFQHLAPDHPLLHLVVVGDGPYLKEMQTQARGLPCTFTGYLEAEDLAMAYASADIFVFPSTTDTFGNVILEAQASGLPVIVTDQGGPSENMLPDETGMVVKGGQWRSLYSGIQSLITAPERRQQMSRAARQYAQNRSFDQAFDHHWQLYEQDDRNFRQNVTSDLSYVK